MLLTSVLAAFGGISAIIQFVGQLFPRSFTDPGLVAVASLGFCVIWGLILSYPRPLIRERFSHPDIAVVVEEGDLFDSKAHLVVGFCDTFDTAVDGGVVISGSSVQGQLLERCYDGDIRRLDQELVIALSAIAPVAREAEIDKPYGKLNRYAIGTVAVLGTRPRLIFAVAYSRIGNDYIAVSSVEELWYSLNRLWDAIYLRAQLESVAMPLIGSGLSRLAGLDQESLLRLILLSFVTRSRERRICRELRIVLRPADLRRIDLSEMGAFVRSLGTGHHRRQSV